VRLLFFTIFLFSPDAFSFVETDLNFIYDKQIFGAKRDNFQISRTYNLNLAWYITGRSAIELGYGVGTIKTTENTVTEIEGTGLEIFGHENTVKNLYYSVGIRHSFAGRNSFFRPMISLGYAKQEITDQTSYKIRATGASIGSLLSQAPQIMESNSVFASFALTIRLSQLFSIKSSIQTVFPAFDFNRAKDDLKYMAGIMWIF
tara:strand:+ start:687 stop:1295 length:609 start_codon:yes stop_codon:yes gene_type:complete